MILENVMTIAEAAQRWGLDRSTLRYAIRDGRLKGKKSGSTWLVTYAAMVKAYGKEPK